MSYDYGTNTLGIKNPFKLDGLLRTITGLLFATAGFLFLFRVKPALEIDQWNGWIHAILGIGFLFVGFRRTSTGAFQMFRFFVGRSVPSSLAKNVNPSESENAQEEAKYVAYDSGKMESMLMGRKNTTFKEPKGWVARLLHTFVPKLIFLPPILRYRLLTLTELTTKILVATLTYGTAYFIAVSGLVGQAGVFLKPIILLLFIIHTLMILQGASSTFKKKRRKIVYQVKTASSFAFSIAFAIMVPVLIGIGFDKLPIEITEKLEIYADTLVSFNPTINLIVLAIGVIVVMACTWLLIQERCRFSKPATEVSEFRENMQESVHPNEIFINVENVVLANRRFKEMPNRIYRNFDPTLNEQSQGKGSFGGQLLIETQPEYQEDEETSFFKTIRLITTIISHFAALLSATWLVLFIFKTYDVKLFLTESIPVTDFSDPDAFKQFFIDFAPIWSVFLGLFFTWRIIASCSRILDGIANVFWAEMHFSSMLMWMKMEGTFTESKVSTGMSIHDSTRSENVVVRSSITPWLITSRIKTSTFASSGMKNLGSPRHIIDMQKNDSELNTIVNEIKTFLKDREAIASITNEKDLANAETIYRVNEATRFQGEKSEENPKQLEEGAAFRIREDETNDESSPT